MKKLLFILATVLSATLSAQTKADYIFFKGDTLVGFDFNRAINEATTKLSMPKEQKVYVKLKENAFVKSKYHLTKLPFEPNTQTQSRIATEIKVATTNTANPACNNADFGLGNFTNWSGEIGYNPNTNQNLVITSAGIVTGPNNSALNACFNYNLMTAAGGTDYFGGFPVVPPNGSGYACRLGGDVINTGGFSCTLEDPNQVSSNGEILKTTIPVTPANFLLTYNYAVVLENAGHSGGENPYFSVELFDDTGAQITVNTLMVESDTTGASITPPGWFTSTKTNTNNPGTPVIYTGWVSNSINLAAYNGTNVTIKFTAAGCIYGGHFGYGYVSVNSCTPMALVVPNNGACVGQNQTIIAPANAGGTYAWSGPGIVSGATSQTVTCNLPGKYSVNITNVQGASYTLDTTITTLPRLSITASKDSICSGATATLTASGALSYTWNNGATTNSIIVSPLSDSTYAVMGVDTSKGCLNVSDTAMQLIKVTNCNTTGISQTLGLNSQISVYPNPANTSLQVSFLGNIESSTLVMTDMLGNTVKKIPFTSQHLTINITDLSEGVYNIIIASNEGTVNKKVVIVR